MIIIISEKTVKSNEYIFTTIILYTTSMDSLKVGQIFSSDHIYIHSYIHMYIYIYMNVYIYILPIANLTTSQSA